MLALYILGYLMTGILVMTILLKLGAISTNNDPESDGLPFLFFSLVWPISLVLGTFILVADFAGKYVAFVTKA